MEVINEIQIEFNRQNFRTVLHWGLDRHPYSHAAIAGWCANFWNTYCEQDAPNEIVQIMPLLAEVERDLDIHFAMSKSKQRRNDEGPVYLPEHYFEGWIQELDRLANSNQSTGEQGDDAN